MSIHIGSYNIKHESGFNVYCHVPKAMVPLVDYLFYNVALIPLVM
jgi:hypothetical protein